MIDGVDVVLNDFFTFLDRQVGLQNVIVALSGDHGVAPTMRAANDAQMTSSAIKSAALLKALDAEKRAIVLLAYYRGSSREALAKRFGRPVPTIKTWLHRSLAQLRDCLAS